MKPPGPWDNMTPEARAEGMQHKARAEVLLARIETAVLPVLYGQPAPDVTLALTMLLHRSVLVGFPAEAQAAALLNLATLLRGLADIRSPVQPTRVDPRGGRRP